MDAGVVFAGHLAQKKAVKNLFVAKTIEAFAKALLGQLEDGEGVRGAFIVSPSFSWCPLPINFPQHKVAVCFEKVGVSLKIAFLDSMPTPRQGSLAVGHLRGYDPEILWDGYGTPDQYNSVELLVRAVFRAIGEKEFNTEFYRSKVKRQKFGGCSIFAGYDAIAFLKNPHFFQEIKCSEDREELPEKRAIFRSIVGLPQPHMRGAHFEESEESRAGLDYLRRKEIKHLTWVVKALIEKPAEANELMKSTLCY